MMKDGIRAAMSEATERETVKRMGQRSEPWDRAPDPCWSCGGESTR